MPVSAANSEGDIDLSMSQCLHTAKMEASHNVCGGANARTLPTRLNEAMNYIKAWREAAGLTQQELGDSLEPPASAGTISAYESGSRNFSMTRLSAIALSLRTSPALLLGGPPQVVLRAPNESDLTAMLATAQQEVPPGAPIEEWRRIVASSLHTQLEFYLADRAKHPNFDGEKASEPEAPAPLPPPTKRGGRAGSRK